MSKNNAMKTVTSKGRAVTAALLLLVILSLTLITTGCSGKFDYLESNLDDYIEFTEDYKNFKVEIDIAKPHDIDVDVAILNMLYADRDEKPLYDGGTVTSRITITSGDVVDIWYRGYLIGDDGEEIEVSGMSNFSDSAPTSLSIGSNSFVPGFEFNLIGKNTGDYSKFNKITSGTLSEGQIAYISYTRVKGTDTDSKVTGTNVRIDLSTDLDSVYGEGFKEKLMGLNIGDKIDLKTTLADSSYTYTDLKVNFATDCENNPMVIECYFPYDYSKSDLRNETAYFEVYVDGVVVYDCPDFTDEYLQKKIEDGELNITLDELNEYEGEKLIDKYRNFAEKRMNEIYEEEYKVMVEEAVWAHLNEISKAKKYPADKVEEVYDDYVDDLSEQFITNGGQIYNSTTGQSKTYDTFDAYVTAYLGLSGSVTWQDRVYSESEGFIKERLTMFYILRAENLLPTDEEFKAEYDAVVQEFIDEAIAQYLYYAGKTEDDYTEEEYADVVEECRDMVFSNFDEDYFSIRTYYRILAKTIIQWPEVSTLDDRRAYPQDK